MSVEHRPSEDRATRRGVKPMTAQERIAALRSPVTGKASPRPPLAAMNATRGERDARGVTVAAAQSPPYSERPGLLTKELPRLIGPDIVVWARQLNTTEEDLLSELQLQMLRKSWMQGSQWDPARASFSLWSRMAAKSIFLNLLAVHERRIETVSIDDAPSESRDSFRDGFIRLEPVLPCHVDPEAALARWVSAVRLALAVLAWQVEEFGTEFMHAGRPIHTREALQRVALWQRLVTTLDLKHSSSPNPPCDVGWDSLHAWLEVQGLTFGDFDL